PVRPAAGAVGTRGRPDRGAAVRPAAHGTPAHGARRRRGAGAGPGRGGAARARARGPSVPPLREPGRGGRREREALRTPRLLVPGVPAARRLTSRRPPAHRKAWAGPP